MKIEIKSRFSLSVLFSAEAENMRLAVEAAVKSDADLRGADLQDANLRGADLRGADLRGANLQGAYLQGAYLQDANLQGADLQGADLRGANLRGANLRGADLDYRQLATFRDDIWSVLSASPAEVPGLLAALENGKVDGSTYEGECACLVGTIANVRGCRYNAMPTLQPDSSRPAEQWFMQIKKGDTPKTSKAAKMAHSWIKEWLDQMTAAFGNNKNHAR